MSRTLAEPPDGDPTQVLSAALRAGRTEAVAEALARFPALRSRLDGPVPGGAFGATPLILAVQHANRELVELLLAAGAEINQRSHWWAGGFHVLEDDHGLADFLMTRGARLDAKSAARLGRLADLEALVAADPAAVHLRAGDGQTPLHVAPTVAIAEFLLEHGAELDALDIDHESTPAQYLVRSHPEVARFLIARGARTDILMAAALGLVERVRELLDADPECVRVTVGAEHFPMRDRRAGGTIYTWTLGAAKTPHALAREFGHDDVFHLLMERSPGTLQLAVACETGDEEALAALLASQPDLARTLRADEIHRLPLAAQHDDTRTVRLLLAAGWPVDATGQHGATALHWAGFHGNADMARGILAHHPALEAKESAHGLTAVGWTLYGSCNGWHVERGGHAAVLELLLASGAKAPAVHAELQASEAVLAVLRRVNAG